MKADPDLKSKRVYAHKRGEHHVLLGNLVEYDPALLEYAAHPKLVPLVEEVVGGKVRLEETEAIINRRDPEADIEELHKRRYNPTGLHRGTQHGWGTYIEQSKIPLHLRQDADLPHRCGTRRRRHLLHPAAATGSLGTGKR